MAKDQVSKDYDHEKEAIWQKKWQKNNIYRFIGDGTKPQYIIDTPPPYPTGSIHMGHVLNWVYMDIIARFMRMKGYDVLFPQGWDCHGLPTEVKVEETYNIKKGDVPREDFRKMCIDLTQKNIKRMKKQMQSLGFSQDWSWEYITMTPWYMRKTQLSFLKFYEEGLIYRAKHPVNWCPRCETAIAFAEVEYHEKDTYLNYLEFQAEDGKGSLQIATTRPELLSACVAVAVHPDDERYKKIIGKHVRVPIFGRKVKIIADRDVEPEFGTGAVMICTFGDKTDVLWVKRHNLDIIEAIDDRGLMKKVAGKYEGFTIEDCKKKITEDLKNKGFLKKQEKISQNVGLCWRCKTPIEILVKKQWFVDVKKLINKVEEASDEIEWIPEYMKIRLLNWTGSMDWDWCISRQRLFATPIPVWYCTRCGKVLLASEDELPVDPTQVKPNKVCSCGCGEFVGEVDVLDTWMDSSITPLVIAKWPSSEFKKLYPSTLRPQGHDIIRTWAFYTILRCKALTDKRPFDKIVVNGMVFGEDGHKMSKSRGNVIEPEAVVKKYGADSLRQWAANSVPGSDVPFAWKDVKYGYKFLRKFWNAFRFINMHIPQPLRKVDQKGDLRSPEFNESFQKFPYVNASAKEFLEDLNPLDRWILSKLNRLVLEVTDSFDSFHFAEAISKIQLFVWHDFCDEYIEAVKHRLYHERFAHSKEVVQYTLMTVLLTILKLLSPITPHFVDEIYQHLTNNNTSIHTTSWPEAHLELIDAEAEKIGEIGIGIIGELRRFKASHKMPLNTKIESANIYTTNPDLHDKIKTLIEDIKGTMRIADLKVKIGKPDVKEKITKIIPKMAKIGPEFRADAPKILEYLKSEDPQKIAEVLDKTGEIVISGCKLTREHIKAKKETVGKTGKKVEILHATDIDVILEIVI